MAKEKHILRGTIAGIAGGLFASWVMNQFIAGPGSKMQTAITHAQGKEPEQPDYSSAESDDSTAKVADTLSVIATGGQHLTYDQKQTGGSAVHYTFGALMGGVYGALAEYAPSVKAGFGTTYATALFTAADLIAVPALNLGKPANEQDAGSLTEYYAAHLVYGISTELVRRVVRLVL